MTERLHFSLISGAQSPNLDELLCSLWFCLRWLLFPWLAPVESASWNLGKVLEGTYKKWEKEGPLCLVAQLLKNPSTMQETPVHIPGSGRSPGEGIGYLLLYSLPSLVSQMVKNLPAVWETWVQSLGWEDPLEESMATHSSILAWRIPMDKEAWWTTVHGVMKSQHSRATKHSTAPQAPSQF